jgi:hypothetical protein
MGLVIDTEASAAAGQAARATREGRTVLLYRQHFPASVAGQPDPVGDLAEVIEAIESQGWALAQLAYDERKSRAGGVLLLFRPSGHPLRRVTAMTRTTATHPPDASTAGGGSRMLRVTGMPR